MIQWSRSYISIFDGLVNEDGDDDDEDDDDGNDDGDDDLLLLHCLSLACVPPPQLALHAPHGPHSLQPGGHGRHDHH